MTQHSLRLVQLSHAQYGRRIAVVKEPELELLTGSGSVYHLAMQTIERSEKISELVSQSLSGEMINYDAVYSGESDWKLLPSFDHPENPAACIVSGTGLTHKNSALNRQMMHQDGQVNLTDSMQMYQWGVEGGHPKNEIAGVQPEWFYKGAGSILHGHGDSLEIPAFGNDGGEEPEVAGVYIVDKNGKPWRIGLTTGNEFSDHVMEKKSYLYLAPSKLRNCSIGPELVLHASFEEVNGTVSIIRSGNTIWSKEIKSGENNMAHSLANIEHHHFKYPGHCIPFQAHVHFFGADAFSFGDQIKLEDKDFMLVHWQNFGRALMNPLRIPVFGEQLVKVTAIP